MISLRASLRMRRLSLGLSANDVAELAKAACPGVRGIRHSAILEWEKEAVSRSPSDRQLSAWAAALGFRIELHDVKRARRSTNTPPDGEDTTDPPSGGRQRPRHHASAA